jgi:hypothetical protein
MYENGVASIMGADIDLINDQIAALLIDKSSYTPDLDNDLSQADIPVAAQIAQVALSGKTIDGTTFRANDSVFVSVTGTTVDAIVLMKDTDNTGTSLLIAFIDNASEFPITPDGTDITIEWDDGANGIFKL